MKRSRKTLFALLLALVMALGLTATAWATEGGVIVDLPGDVPGVGNNVVQKTIRIPFIKTVTRGGNTDPGETEFELEIFNIGNRNVDCKNVPYTAAVTTNGAGSYGGELVISGPADQVKQFVIEGFSVREKNNNLPGWTYSDAVWRVEPSGTEEDENGIPTKMNIYPTKLEKTENGENYVNGETPVDKMTFENIYTYSTTPIRREKPNTPEPAITAPKTFDAGVALYGVSALLSLAGTALVIKRKNG